MNRHALTRVIRPGTICSSALRRPVVARASALNVVQTSHATRIFTGTWQQSSFMTSARQHATEDNPGVKNDPEIVETADKSPLSAVLSENPQLLASVHRFIEVANEEGIDLTDPNPSFSTLMKMAGNQRIKDAATKLREEFESAGLQVSKEDALKVLSGLKDAPK